MLGNTLLDAIRNLKAQYQLTPYQQSKFDEYFSVVKEGDFIYAGQLKSRLAIDIKKAYDILEALKSEGYLVNIYEVYCTDCSKSKGVFLNTISDFDEDTCCDFCDKHLNPLDNLIVLYKVVALWKK